MNRRGAIKAVAGTVAGIVGLGSSRSPRVEAYDGTVWIDAGTIHRYGEAVPNGTILPEMVLVPMPDMEPGRAYCPRCDELPEVTFPWQGPDHIAVRLWDDGHDLRALQMPTHITVDGHPVKYVLEAYAGPFGWAIVEPDVYCPRCRIEHTRELLTGDVVFDQPSRDATIARLGEPYVRAVESHALERTG